LRAGIGFGPSGWKALRTVHPGFVRPHQVR